MGTIDKKQLLYSFFVANSGSEISYQRLKNLSQSINEMTDQSGQVYSALSILMRRGLVEQSDLSKYRLSPTCLIRGEKFHIGVNLPSEELTQLASFSLGIDRGLGIYEPISYATDIPTYDFAIRKILANCGNIRSVCYKLLGKVEEMPRFTALESYDAAEKKFIAQKDFLSGANLYKVYSFSKLHFDYIFGVNSLTEGFRFYRFHRYDFETLNMYRAMLSIGCGAPGIAYLMRVHKLVIDQYFPFPNTLERVLFLNSVLSEGDFPKGRIYALKVGEFSHLQKIFNNKITINYEEYI